MKPIRILASIATLTLALAAATTLATAQTYKDVYNFGSVADGYDPIGILAQGADGNLYGTTYWGGANNCGTAFRMTPSGKETILYNFQWDVGRENVNGCNPDGGLTLGLGGTLYGTATFGGSSGNCSAGCGTIFKISPAGILTGLFSFYTSYTGPGIYPSAAPILGTDGNLYGPASNIGLIEGGTYKVTPSGSLSVLALVTSAAPLLLGTDGNFYGTTAGDNFDANGVVFKLTPQGTITTLYTFDGTNGSTPYFGALVQGTGASGNFYGTTMQGGAYGAGVVFQLTPQGSITVLHNFADPNVTNDGSTPLAGLLQATDGNFYGVTTAGGSLGYGTIFKITPAGSYSIVYNFDSTHGATPQSTLMQHTNGKLYGLAVSGGTNGNGVLYSLNVGLGPFASLVPALGKVGSKINILGQGFTGTTNVTFNGTPASFTILSDTFLQVTVPAGATTGLVTVASPGGTLKSNKVFHVRQ